MQQRAFLQLMQSGNGNGDIWLDIDRIVAVRETDAGTFVYLDDIEPAALVVESGAEIMDRLHRAAEAMAAQR